MHLCVKSELMALDTAMGETTIFFLAIFREKTSQRKFPIVIQYFGQPSRWLFLSFSNESFAVLFLQGLW